MFACLALKEGLYRIQILCRRHPFWSYPAWLTKAAVSLSVCTPLSPSLFTPHQILYSPSLTEVGVILGVFSFFVLDLQLVYCLLLPLLSFYCSSSDQRFYFLLLILAALLEALRCISHIKIIRCHQQIVDVSKCLLHPCVVISLLHSSMLLESGKGTLIVGR